MAAQQDPRPSAWEEKQQQIAAEHDAAMQRAEAKRQEAERNLEAQRQTERAAYAQAGGSTAEFDAEIWPLRKREILTGRVAAQLRASSARAVWDSTA